MTQPRIRTAFIGLGSQGGPMASRMLQAGFPLTVWARRPDALKAFVAAGAHSAASISDLGRESDHVGICVVDDAGVLAICEELIPAMPPGSLLAIHSTILPETCESLSRRCAERDILFVDAPVSGGGGGAAAGTLSVMCGGAPDAFAKARPVFAAFGGTIVLLGPVGSGQRAKIVNNALMAGNLGLADAALAVGASLGIDRQALAELIKHSSGRSFAFEVCARLRSPTDFQHGAPLLMKDINLLASIAPEEAGTARLREAALAFLAAAVGKPRTTNEDRP